MTTSLDVALIVAMDDRHLIGHAGTLPWHLPADLRRFRDLTMGHTLVMGRKTFTSIGRCLPGRTSIVLTRQKDLDVAGGIVATDWQSALNLADTQQRLFVIGGAEIYRITLPDVRRMYVTFVQGEFRGDTYFPDINWDSWRVVREQSLPADDKNPYPTRFVEFVRSSLSEDD